MDNSFAALREHQTHTIDVMLQSATFVEQIYPDIDGVSEQVIAEAVVSDASYRDAGRSGPAPVGRSLRVEFRSGPEEQLLGLGGKFPLGWLEVSDVTECLVVMVRPTLMSNIVASLPLLAVQGVSLCLHVPDLEGGDVPALLPVVNYTFRASTKAS
jgi:hypothetical protein